MMTVETFGRAKPILLKLIDDLEQTIAERERLEHEAMQREAVVEQLNIAMTDRDARIAELERRNSTLVDDIVRLEAQVGEQDAILTAVRQAANGTAKAAA